MIKTKVFWWKTKKNTKKSLSKYEVPNLYSKPSSLARDETHSKLSVYGENKSYKKLPV